MNRTSRFFSFLTTTQNLAGFCKQNSKLHTFTSKLASRTPVALACAILASTIILFIRRPDQFLHPQFWAEDGAVFFEMANQFGSDTLLLPYAGYFHTYQRIWSLISTQFPVSWAPSIFCLAALLLWLATVFNIFSSRLNLPYPFLLAIFLVSVPHNGEIILQLVNVHFLGGFLLLLILLKEPSKNLKVQVVEALSVAILSVTGPHCVFLAAIAWLSWSINRRKSGSTEQLVKALIVSICAIITAIAVAHQTLTPLPAGDSTLLQMAKVLGQRSFGEMLLPAQFIMTEWVWLGTLILGTFLAASLIKIIKEKDHVALGILIYLVALLASTGFRFRDNIELLFTQPYNRYSYIPIVLIGVLLLNLSLSKVKFLRGFCQLAFLVTIFWSSTHFTLSRTNLSWSDRSKCLEQRTRGCSVPIHPGWDVRFPSRNHR